jgi:hypothetical protein
MPCSRSRDGSVGTATGYELNGRGSIPGLGKIFLFSTGFRPAIGPTQTHSQWVREAISLGIKWPGREADHLPPSSAAVNNGGAIPPLPPMSLWRNA